MHEVVENDLGLGQVLKLAKSWLSEDIGTVQSLLNKLIARPLRPLPNDGVTSCSWRGRICSLVWVLVKLRQSTKTGWTL